MPTRKPIPNQRYRLATVLVAVFIATISFPRKTPTQQTADKPALANTSAEGRVAGEPRTIGESENEYRIGPGDQLSIQVFNRSQLSREERVDMRGMIRMPLIDGDIRAACRTRNELAEEIARLYRERDLLRNPAVFVSVTQFESQPVAVIGSVNSPGRFSLRRRIRLLELVVFHAGGPSTNAGRKIQVLSTVPQLPCEAPGSQPIASHAEGKAESAFATYDLAELLAGKEPANPYVHQGDIINIPAAEQAFILGNVKQPTTIPIVRTVTLGRALAMAGGLLPNTNKDKIRVVRETSSGTTAILVDLNAADKTKGVDFPLQGGDVVEVATKGGFSKIMRDIANTIIPTLTSMPTRVVY